jgi:hypothetical protein
MTKFDIPQIREALQEMHRSAFAPSPVIVGELVAAMVDGPHTAIMHLGESRAQCGMPTERHRLTVEHNDITCPLCFSIHEAAMATIDDESVYYEWDTDSILETDAFMDDCVRQIMQRLAQKKLAAEERFLRSILSGNAIDGSQFE